MPSAVVEYGFRFPRCVFAAFGFPCVVPLDTEIPGALRCLKLKRDFRAGPQWLDVSRTSTTMGNTCPGFAEKRTFCTNMAAPLAVLPYDHVTTQVIEVTQDVVDVSGGDEDNRQRHGVPEAANQEQIKRRAFLRELHAMIRLRSPHTVNVFGAITSSEERLVLVMELLVGGDLRMLLKSSRRPLPTEQSRRIIRDVCAGLAFLHSKDTIHGDLKSANVLLDGAGRAKVNSAESTGLFWVASLSSTDGTGGCPSTNLRSAGCLIS